MKRLLCSTVCLFALTGGALSADLPTKKAPPPPPVVPAAWNWTGAYVGLNIGAAWDDSSYSVFRTTTGKLQETGSSSTGGQFRGGGQLGYRYEFANNIVVGAQIAVDFGPNYTTANTTRSLTDSSIVGGGVQAQLGYAFGDLLPYVTGGYAGSAANVSRTQLTGNGAPPAYTDTTSASKSGWTAGAGVDYHVWGGWFVSAQYRYAWFAQNSVTYPLAKFYQTTTTNAQSALFGVNYKF